MFRVIAMNDQGAPVIFKGKTMKEALSAFDDEYHRSGWKIHIEDSDGIVRRIVRNSLRK